MELLPSRRGLSHFHQSAYWIYGGSAQAEVHRQFSIRSLNCGNSAQCQTFSPGIPTPPEEGVPLASLEVSHVRCTIRGDVTEQSLQGPQVGECAVASIAYRWDPITRDHQPELGIECCQPGVIQPKANPCITGIQKYQLNAVMHRTALATKLQRNIAGASTTADCLHPKTGWLM